MVELRGQNVFAGAEP